MKVDSYDIECIDECIEILLNEDIISIIDNNNEDYGHTFWQWTTYMQEHYSNFDIKHGASKIVIILDEVSDWVIKIPFMKEQFNDKDYCAIEEKNYEKAKENHVEQYFAETFFYKEEYGVDFYLQRRADCDEDSIDSALYDYTSENNSFDEVRGDYVDRNSYRYSKEELNQIEEEFNEDDYFDEIWSIIDDYEDSERTAAILDVDYDSDCIDFIRNNKINDLHNGNFGYINGEPVLIDYSGFYN